MKITIWGFLMFFTFVTVCFAQQNDSNTDQKNGGNVILKAGTEISAQLEKALDVENTKNSDDFVLKTVEDITGNGANFAKGTELLGRVVRVKKIDEDADKTSEISLFFDFLKDGDDYLRFKASIISVVPDAAQKENPAANKIPEMQFAVSPVFKGATVISSKGKNLQIQEGTIFRLKLNEDLIKK